MKLDPHRPVELFERAERESWAVTSLRFADERAQWNELPASAKAELWSSVSSLALGEEIVTRTLTPLIHAAPTRAQRLFLSTQMADEARHTLFFERWMATVEPELPRDDAWIAGCRDRSPEGLRVLLDATLPSLTDQVRVTPGDLATWYRAVLVYHLLLEGVALVAFRGIAQIVTTLGKLPALAEGLRRIIKDESRHVAFGVDAIANGVAAGFQETLVDVIREQTPATARRLVEPERPNVPLLFPELNESRASRMWEQWGAARVSVVSRLRAAGIDEATVDVAGLWNEAVEAAFEQHRVLHGKPHVASVFRRASKNVPEEAPNSTSTL